MSSFRPYDFLCELFGVAPTSVVAVMGAGGKHTLIYRLAAELQWRQRHTGRRVVAPAEPPPEARLLEEAGLLSSAEPRRGEPVIVTATTNFHRPRLGPHQVLLLDEPDEGSEAWAQRFESGLAAGSQLFIFEKEFAPGMLQGIDSCSLWELRQLCADVPMLIKTDGARKRCFKAPSGDEPDIPIYDADPPLKGFRPDVCILVFGLDCIGQPLGPDTTHRPERVTELTGLQPGEEITPRELALVASHPEAYHRKLPADSRKVLYLSKARRDEDLHRAAEVFEGVDRARFHLLAAGDTLAGSFYEWNDECRSPNDEANVE